MYMPIEFCWSNNVYRTWGCAVVSYCKKARPPLSGFLTLWKTNNFWTVVLHAEWILGQMSRWFKFGERKLNLKEASYARDWSVWQESRCMCIGELCEQPTAIVCLLSLSPPSIQYPRACCCCCQQIWPYMEVQHFACQAAYRTISCLSPDWLTEMCVA